MGPTVDAPPIFLWFSVGKKSDFRHLSTRQKRLVDFLEVKTDWIDENSRRWLIQDHSRANREPLPNQNRVSYPNLFPNNNSNGFNDQSMKKPATILVPNTYSDQEVVSMLSAQAGFQNVVTRKITRPLIGGPIGGRLP